MDKNISIEEIETRLRAVLEDVAHNGTEYVVDGNGDQAVALLPFESLVELRKMAARERRLLEQWRTFERDMAALTADISEEEVAADAAAAIQEVRAERRRRPA